MFGMVVDSDKAWYVTKFLLLIPPIYICHAPSLISIVAELVCSGIQSVVGEDCVLVQAIISIKSIIKLDPRSYEKVFSSFLCSYETFKPSVHYLLFVYW